MPLVEEPDPEALRALAGTPWGGVLSDPAGRDVAVELVLRDAPAGSRFGTFPAQAVRALLERCRARVLQGSGVRLHVVGSAGFNHASLEGVRRFRWLNLLILALLLVLCRALFGTWRCGLLLIGALAAAGLLVYGAMSLAGAPIDLLSTGLFLMLSVAAIEDYLFLCARQLREGVGLEAELPHAARAGLLHVAHHGARLRLTDVLRPRHRTPLRFLGCVRLGHRVGRHLHRATRLSVARPAPANLDRSGARPVADALGPTGPCTAAGSPPRWRC